VAESRLHVFACCIIQLRPRRSDGRGHRWREVRRRPRGCRAAARCADQRGHRVIAGRPLQGVDRPLFMTNR
jgi:hypothetical protein